MRLVVDTNVFVSGIVADRFTAQAAELFALASPLVELVAPQVLVAETAHVLLRRLRQIPEARARTGYETALGLPFVRPHDAPLNRTDFDLGLRHTIGGSDLFFVRLAVELGCPLVTQDGLLRTNASEVIEAIDLETALARIAS